MIRKLIAAICLAVSLGVVSLHGQDASRTLITNALEETDIFSDRQFVLDADVSATNRKNRAKGKYQLIWLGPEKWREEIQLGTNKVTRIGSKGVVYERSTSDTAEEMLLVFAKMFRFRAELEFPLTRKLSLKKKNVKQFQRVTFDSDRGATLHFLSFDQGHFVFASNYGMPQGTDDRWSEVPEFQELRDYRPTLGKQFPFKLSSEYRGSSFVAAVQSIRVVEVDSIDPAVFVSDQSFRETRSCFQPIREQKTKAEPLQLPFQRFRGRTNPGSTSVSVPDAAADVISLDPRSDVVIALIFTTVSEKGTVSSARLLTASSVSDTALVNAIRQSKYEPPVCNGEPASYSTIIQVQFRSYPRTP